MRRTVMKRLKDIFARKPGREKASAFDHAAGQLRKTFAKLGGDPAVLYKVLGEELSEAGRHKEAAKAFMAAISAHPDDAATHIAAANALLLSDNPQEAAKLWGTVRRRFSSRYTEDEQRKHGQALLRSEAFDEANTLFEHLLEARPDVPWGIAGLARVAEKSRRWDEAVRLWERCLDDHADRANPSWSKALERCKSMARGERTSAPMSEETARSEAAKAYFRLMSRADDGERTRPNALNFQSVLVVTYGRSGSTLLQGVLNSIDGMLLRGENGNAFFSLFEAYDTLSRASEKYTNARSPNSPWFGIGLVDLERVLNELRDVARTIVLSDRADDGTVTCFGFKEIRYDEVGDRFEDYLRFLETLFPQAGFVFLTRRLDDVLNSAWWKERDPEEVRRRLEETEGRFAGFANGRSNCFQITYEDIVSRSDRLRLLFEFLGAPYRPGDLDIVMAAPHSYEPTRPEIRKLFKES